MAFFPTAKNSSGKTPEIDITRIPQHIAIIMDGNGRWASKRGLPRYMGHKKGVEALKSIVKACISLDVRILSVFAFSTENWKRPKEEVDILMELLAHYLATQIEELNDNGVRVHCIGSIDKLPNAAQREIEHAHAKTINNKKLILNVALNYGGRLEIVEATKCIAEKVKDGLLDPKDIDENIFASHLFTCDQSDPDLLIRPSGELRLSNFFLWQTAYTELFVSDVLWPDFTKLDLLEAIAAYQNRDRRYGGLKC